MAKASRGKASGKNKTLLPDYAVTEFLGLNTYIKDLKMLQDGETPDSLNWITGRYKDNIALRQGSALLGLTRRLGSGRVSGLEVGTTQLGAQTPFWTYGQHLMYYNGTDNVETGSSIFPAAAASDDFSIMPYKNIAGCFVYLTSPNSSMYKIAVGNPGSYVNLSTNGTGTVDYKGHAKAVTNRMILWNRIDLKNQKYTSVIYNSVPDVTSLSQYTQTTAQNVGTGDGMTKAFTGSTNNTTGTIFNVEFAGAIAPGTTITNIVSSGSVTNITAAGNTFAVGDIVLITGVSGMTQINGLFGVVTVPGSTFTIQINSGTFTAYSSGGTAYKCEYFIDDQNGNMNSYVTGIPAGGTGTINYGSGAWTLNFATAPIAGSNIYLQYYSEGIANSIADFTDSGAASYTQFDGGGDIQNLYSFDQVEYCFHLLTTWYLNIANSSPFNLPYRNRLGTPYLRAGFATEDGVVYLDNSIPSQPRVQILEIDANASTAVVTVVPNSISDQLDLSNFGFSKCAVFRWNDFDIIACAPSQNGVEQTTNTALFVRNIYSGQWDYCNLPASCFAELNGTLLAGDALSNNVFTLFSGYTDDSANINNYWTSKLFNVGAEGLKKFNRFVVKGLIQQDQVLNVNFSFDSGEFITFFTIEGNGSYVNLGNPVTIGNSTVGSHIIGGGGDVITAYPFEVEFIVNGSLFEYVQCQFQAMNIGYAEVDEFTFKDVRYKSRRVLPTRTANPD